MTDATNPTAAERAVATLRAERSTTLRALAHLSDADLATRIEWRGGTQPVNQRVMAFGTHMIDHQQHLARLQIARGRPLTAAEYLWVKNAALTAELEAMCLVLADDEFTAQGPADGDWSAEQILEHVIKTERNYRERILAGLEAARTDAEAGGTAGA
jgi:uncharacterized damage-inducible protein DinB